MGSARDHASPARPFFYVSSSPWNLYGFIAEFMERNAIPHGPMFLKDYGIDRTQFIRKSHDAHKVAASESLNQLAVAALLPATAATNPGGSLNQWANKAPTSWQNGSLNDSNSSYAENDSVPFRLTLTNLGARGFERLARPATRPLRRRARLRDASRS